MAVSEQVPANSSTGNGATTLFPYTFKILREEDLEVTVDGVPKTLNTDYIVSGVGNDAGGNVAFTTAPASGTTVIRRRNMAFVRTTDYQYQGELPNDVLNDDQDAPILMLQQLNEQVGRALKVPVGEGATEFLPSAAERAGMFLGFDASGNPVALTGAGSGDTALRTDLAAGTGGALVGFNADIPDPADRSIEGKLQEMALTPQDCDTLTSGALSTAAATLAAFQKHAAASARRKHIPAGNYDLSMLTGPLEYQPNDVLTGDGDATVLDASGSSLPAGSPVIRIAGTFTSLGAILSGAVAEGVDGVPLTSVAGIAKGDVLVIYNPTDSSWSTHRAYYRAGEFLQVGLINGTTVYPQGPIYDAYAGTETVYKLGGTSAQLENFRIKTPANASLGWQIDASVYPVVRNVHTSGSTYTGGEFKRCFGIHYEGSAFQSTVADDDEYGVTVSNSQSGNFYLTATGGRHSIAFGGGDYAGCVPCRNFSVYGSLFGNLGPTGAGNLHGNTEDIKFFGITFSNGLDVGGANHKFDSCAVRGNGNSGIAIYASEPVKGSFEFNHLTIKTYVNPNTSSYGVVNIGNIDADVKGALQFVFNSPIIDVPAATLFPFLMDITAGSYAPDIIINSPIIKAGAGITQLLRLQRSGGASTIDSITIGPDVTGLKSGAAYVTNAGAGLTVTNYRLPVQTGSKSVPVTAAASTHNAVVTFRHPYPVAPKVTTGLSTSTIGGDRATSVAASVGTDTFAAEVATCDGGNFAGVDTAVVSWNARLGD